MVRTQHARRDHVDAGIAFRADAVKREGIPVALGVDRSRGAVPIEIAYLCDHREAIPTLAQWHHDDWAHRTPDLTIEDRIHLFESRAHRDQIPTAFVAFVKGEVAGLACLVEHDLETHRDLTPWLASVLVGPTFRRRGIGSALSDRTVREAARLGWDTLFLMTLDKAKFYRRLGWRSLERTTHRGAPALIMTKDLTADPG